MKRVRRLSMLQDFFILRFFIPNPIVYDLKCFGQNRFFSPFFVFFSPKKESDFFSPKPHFSRPKLFLGKSIFFFFFAKKLFGRVVRSFFSSGGHKSFFVLVYCLNTQRCSLLWAFGLATYWSQY